MARGNEEALNHWATETAAGEAHFAWGTPGDFDRCVAFHERKGLSPEVAKGHCANLHHRALGVWPGQEHKKAEGTVDEQGVEIAKVGPKGYEHGWRYVGGPGLPKPRNGRKPTGAGHAEPASPKNEPKQGARASGGSVLHDVKGRTYTLTAQDKKDVKAAKLSTNQQMAYTAHRFSGLSHQEALRRAKQSAKAEGDSSVDTAHGWVPILKKERQDDGTLIVEGIATDSGIDRDQQIADPAWLAKAMPEWFRSGGNIREQHDGRRAAGVAVEYTPGEDGHRIRARIVDPVTIAKIEHGVLKGFSFGARNARVTTDKSAAGGRIVDGQIYEVSVVDRPANPRCTLTIAKAEGDGPLELVDEPQLVEKDDDEPRFTPTQFAELLKGLGKARGATTVEKKDFTDEERQQLADQGKAMPDGSFPIRNVSDLKNAIRAIGRAKDPEKAKAWIKRRAKELGREDLVSGDAWKADGEPDDMVHDPADIAAVRAGLIALIKAELDELENGEDELCDIAELLCSLKMLMCWWDHEADEGETTDPYPNGDEAPTDHGDHPVPIVMAADGEKTTQTERAAEQAETLTKADVAALIEDAITKADEAHKAELAALRAELAEVKATPIPGGPARTRTSGQTAIAAQADSLRATEERLQKMVDTTSGPLQQGYRERLKAVQEQLRELAAVNGG
ncbi:MAG: hypothetical protein QJR12_16835 [Mycobacterium sp.]|uniref:hypothetical protein n=1 Tax=Mycobacterium sp. TaxID=1785 RepID=UPI002611692F|nr:hypothetical protein [Mycobacterium sp.]MDI3315873.1 hypothetical protein [Mycobacterium sp.]